MTTTSTVQVAAVPAEAARRSIEGRIADELGVRETQVVAAVGLLDGGSTVPFIARYRKEVTGTLDDTQLRTLEERLRYLRELEERRAAILESIRSQGKLDDGLEAQINAADSKARLEDIYLPYKPKRRTKAQIAREAGLEPLADALLGDPTLDPTATAAGYADAEKGVADAPAALDGARAILVERFAEDADLIGELRERMWGRGRVVSKVREGKEEAGAKFSDYFAFDEPFTSLPSHRVLALLRGEKEEILDLDLDPEPEDADPTAPVVPSGYETAIAARFGVTDAGRPADRWLGDTVRWAWRTRVLVHLGIDLRLRLFQAAEDEAVRVFATNLRDLLLAAPAGTRATMGLDPGYRTGVKVAVVDATGKCVATDTIYPHVPARRWDEALVKLHKLCAAHQVELIAIGNGTASRETDKLAEELVRGATELKLTKIVVSEAGASVYSASAFASKELPGMDVSLRGAVSIARRLQDPLAELVKIDPKSIGVGQYQHDLSELKLSRSLDAVVEDAVNAVGVDVNTASTPLLTRVSGIGATLAENIVAHRDATGPFRTRTALREVPRLGPKAFEQCAGFLRIPDGDDPLDASSVHPESYPVVRRILTTTNGDLRELIGNSTALRAVKATDFVDETFGLPTVTDILAELEKPGRDPRPAFKTATFADGVHEISDLVAGMVLEGVVTNVAAFGAFVDVGVHQDGLVHVSAMSKTFVRDPREVAKPGDIVKVKVLDVDVPRKRISLTLRLDDDAAAGGGGGGGGREGRAQRSGPRGGGQAAGGQPGGGRPGGGQSGGGQGSGQSGAGQAGGRDGGREARGTDGRGPRRDAGTRGAPADGRGGGGQRGGASRGNGQRGGRPAAPPNGAIADALRRAGLVDENGKPRTGR
ncbi:RNA-binding transcriptional accessory protein [Frankia sp. AgB1.9]|uniref:Tex family protein n=1 Tax=unclassified Frankia TaxID=2632575 RepID=UPI0019331973|nr:MULTISPECIES: Tex family protein [unclassified Frankia]MBL7493311.1 RNA-binding transcriptional accessory protein [Frankia sp. AgW1.1]MBL7546432.1 RNA-binding transcriptional accessory protein [Frankia sp. AgB1.9]MBL7620909.1 RNA-binding transcriptional accessory protein [Frankia sp. AgB1.8]